MKVMKFGGTSVGSIESLRNLRDIVNAAPKPVLVVVSAMGGFTNQLLAMCEQAQQRDISCLDTLEQARQRHHSTAAQAARCALEAGAGRLLLGHFSSRIKDLSPLLAEARAIFPDTVLLSDGDLFDLPLQKP